MTIRQLKQMLFEIDENLYDTEIKLSVRTESGIYTEIKPVDLTIKTEIQTGAVNLAFK